MFSCEYCEVLKNNYFEEQNQSPRGVLLRPAALLKKRLWYRCFPVNFAKFLKTPFLTEHLRWLLLEEHPRMTASVSIVDSLLIVDLQPNRILPVWCLRCPIGNHMFKVSNRNNNTICSGMHKLTIKTPEQRL